jgi:hypothetical protein|tara:strand:+ start:598 stop:735 length:138 start_codon:yes stop_codon:yes gene_type:complete
MIKWKARECAHGPMENDMRETGKLTKLTVKVSSHGPMVAAIKEIG